MSVDVPAGQAWVEVTTGTRNGLAHVVSDATANIAVSASHATLPRIDQVILQYNDTQVPTGSGDVPTLSALAGTATAGATLDNRTGAAALGNDRIRLADILVPAASTSVTTANIRDRRPWARGAYNRLVRTASNLATTTVTPTFTEITQLKPRIECSGAPVVVTFTGTATHSAAGAGVQVGLFLDGAGIDGATALMASNAYVGATPSGFALRYVAIPTPGSHQFSPAFMGSSAGTSTILGTTTNPCVFTVEEIVRQNTDNT